MVLIKIDRQQKSMSGSYWKKLGIVVQWKFAKEMIFVLTQSACPIQPILSVYILCALIYIKPITSQFQNHFHCCLMNIIRSPLNWIDAILCPKGHVHCHVWPIRTYSLSYVANQVMFTFNPHCLPTIHNQSGHFHFYSCTIKADKAMFTVIQYD